MSMSFYHGLLADTPRVEAFRRLIRECVSPGDVVVEVGSGLGTYSFFAAEAGARSVWGIESDPVVHVAEHLARTNGLEDRVRFLRGDAPHAELPEKADVLIFEDFPARLLDRKTVRLLGTCADRYLKPGGTVLPARARVSMAPVSCPEVWNGLFPFGSGGFEAYGFDMAATAGYVGNAPEVLHLPEGSLCAQPRVLAEVPIHPAPAPERLGGHAEWTVAGGAVHGIAYWFELAGGDDSWFAPASPREDTPGGGVWGQVFLPFEVPIPTVAGDRLRAKVQVHAFSDGTPGWLSWTGAVGSVTRTAHEFAAEPASLADLFPNPADDPAEDVAGQDLDQTRRRVDPRDGITPGTPLSPQ